MRRPTIRVILKLIEEPQENSIYLQKTLAAAQVRITNHWTHDYHVGIDYVFEVKSATETTYFIFNTPESPRLFIIPDP